MKKFIVSLVIPAMIILGAIGIRNNGYLKTRVYFGHRITGTFTMLVDGKSYQPTKKYFKYEGSGKAELPMINRLPYFFIKAGKYGMYEIEFVLDNKELYTLTGDETFLTYDVNPSLLFQYISYNWWHITEMTLSAEIAMYDGKWIVTAKVIRSESDEMCGSFEYAPIEESFDYAYIQSRDSTMSLYF